MSNKRSQYANFEEMESKDRGGEAYEEYLLLLQQRNRILKKLKEKDEKQLDLEKREQGFSLYLNGANVGLHLSGNHRSRKTKTAGEPNERKTPSKEDLDRARTAPSAQKQRRGWHESPPDKIKIRTNEGSKLTMDLPDSVTGNYEEDFEVYQSLLETKLLNEDNDVGSSGSSDQSSDDEEDGGHVDEKQLTFTVEDLKTLRASLEKDSSIRQSIAEAVEEFSGSDTDDDDDLSDAEGDRNTDRNKGTGMELEEIEEEILEDALDSSQYIMKDISEEIIEVDDGEPDSNQSDSDNEIGEGFRKSGKRDSPVMMRSESPTFDLKPKKWVELSGAAPKSRPVTASRRVVDDNTTYNAQASIDLANAIIEENKKLEEFKGKRQLKSAPAIKRTPPLEANTIEDRPLTVQGLSNEDISSITERVRKMPGRQQIRLLKMLADLEQADETTKELKNLNIDENDHEKYIRHQKNKRKHETLPQAFTTSLKHATGSSTSSSYASSISVDTPRDVNTPDSSRTCEAFELQLHFHSNWGHKEFIGITEIQLLNENNSRIRIHSKDLKVKSTHAQIDEMKNMINHKTKTTKEKYMWRSTFLEDQPLILSIKLRDLAPNDIHKIVVWNYNKNLQELNMGVKDCDILIDGHKIWCGVIDKGCGNQIFDYSKTIVLHESKETVKSTSPQSSSEFHTTSSLDTTLKPSTSLFVKDADILNRPGTRTVDRSGENHKQLPVVEVASPPSKTRNKTSSSFTDEEDVKFSPRSKKTSGSKPVWLTESSANKQKHQPEEIYIDDSLRPRSRPSSGRRSQQKQHASLTVDDDLFTAPKAPRSRPSSGRRSQLLESASPSPDLLMDDKDEDVEILFDLNSKPKRGRPEHLADSMDTSVSVNMTHPSNEGRSQRQLFKEVMDVNLEQSLRSIDKFKFHHLGRIHDNLAEEEDQLIGSLLQPMKREDHQRLLDDNNDDVTMTSHSIEVEEEEEMQVDENSPRFEIPLLPKGKELIINIKTTWGDKHYVGLNGIEVFMSNGQLAPIKSIQANPPDINVLPEYEGDPRVVANLVDGCYLTRDDMHLWLAPYTTEGDHLVAIEFEEEVTVSMIRVWNYNKSRIHSSRGARFVEMALDGKLVFIGEIARASGVLSAEDPYGDTILFTTDEDILELVSENDELYVIDSAEDEDQLAASFDLTKRPSTGNEDEEGENEKGSANRPFTAPKARDTKAFKSHGGGGQLIKTIQEEGLDSSDAEDNVNEEEDPEFVECQSLCIFFTGTWGDHHYLGLTGLEVLGHTFEAIPIRMDMLEAVPRDLNDLDDYDDDDRTLDKLLNGVNVTMSDENMWMIPYEEGNAHYLKVNFNEPTIVTGLRIWNYNKSLEDTYRGARVIHVYSDDKEISPENGYYIRKGPGHCHFDYAQDIIFNITQQHQSHQIASNRKVNLRKVVDEYETVVMPRGFVFQIRLLSSWGDQYYIGLNGIQIYDQYGDLIQLTDNNITAYPHSCNVLEAVKDDLRTPDKLVDDVNDTYDGRHMWLAPVFPGQPNIIYIVFDEPITVSMLKIWNYSKTPVRGVRQFGVLVDDLLVYSGDLPQPALFSRGIIPGVQVPVQHHTILFSDTEDIALKEKAFLLSSSVSMEEQEVTLTNDRSVLKSHKEKFKNTKPNQELRPMTSVTSRR
eukprot:TCONS_00045727-protein